MTVFFTASVKNYKKNLQKVLMIYIIQILDFSYIKGSGPFLLFPTDIFELHAGDDRCDVIAMSCDISFVRIHQYYCIL